MFALSIYMISHKFTLSLTAYKGKIKGKRNHQRRNYLRISQSRQGEIPAVVLLDGAGHNSFLDFVRLTEYNIPTNDMEVCYV